MTYLPLYRQDQSSIPQRIKATSANELVIIVFVSFVVELVGNKTGVSFICSPIVEDLPFCWQEYK